MVYYHIKKLRGKKLVFELIKRILCNHKFVIVEDEEWVNNLLFGSSNLEDRKYLVCLKCGYKRKISRR